MEPRPPEQPKPVAKPEREPAPHGSGAVGADASVAALVAAARLGDPEALAGLYIRHRDFVFRCAHRRLRDQHAAWDVTHDVFVHLAGRLGGEGSQGTAPKLDDREGSTLRGYLYRSAMSVCATRLRRDGPGGVRERVLRLVGLSRRAEETPGHDSSDESGSGEAGSDQSSLLRAALDRLSPSHRAVIELRLIEELSLEEIARATDVPVGTVKSRLHHALAQMRADPKLRSWWEAR